MLKYSGRDVVRPPPKLYARVSTAFTAVKHADRSASNSPPNSTPSHVRRGHRVNEKLLLERKCTDAIV